MEYRVTHVDVGSMVSRDVAKAATELAERVNELLAQGWSPVGGVSSVEAGTGIYLLQAVVRGPR